MSESMLSDAEIKKLLMASVQVRKGGITETEIECIVNWAEGVRLDATLLGLVLSGDLYVDWKNDEPVFFPSDKIKP